MRNFNLKPLGGGAGLRHSYFEEIISKQPDFGWFEIISEDFIRHGGWARECLEEIRKTYPVIGHSVGLSLGSVDPLDMEALEKMKVFYDQINTPWASDHLCFTMIDHQNLNELIPLPFTSEAVENAAAKIRQVQDTLERPFLVENVTRYITVSDREMTEAEFITQVLEKADCGLLLDLTNVYLNSKYHNYDALEFIKSLPLERVGQIHLAGSEERDGHIIDSHDAPVFPEVWELLKETLKLTGLTSILVEWDNSLPLLEQLLVEVKKSDQLLSEYSCL